MVRLGVTAVEPTTSLHSILDGFPVRLGVDPLSEGTPDYIEVPDDQLTDDLRDKLYQRLRYYGYRLNAEQITEALFEALELPEFSDLREEWEDIQEEMASLEEAVTEALGGRDPDLLVEEMLLLEDSKDEAAKVAYKAMQDAGLPRNYGDALQMIHEYLYTPKGLDLPEDTTPEEANRAMQVAWEDYAEKVRRNMDIVSRQLQRTAKEEVEPSIWELSKTLARRLWQKFIEGIKKIIVWTSKTLVRMLFGVFKKPGLAAWTVVAAFGELVITGTVKFNPLSWMPHFVRWMASVFGVTNPGTLTAIFASMLALMIGSAILQIRAAVSRQADKEGEELIREVIEANE